MSEGKLTFCLLFLLSPALYIPVWPLRTFTCFDPVGQTDALTTQGLASLVCVVVYNVDKPFWRIMGHHFTQVRVVVTRWVYQESKWVYS